MKISWMVGAAVLLMPGVCHAQVVARDTDEAWAVYERSVLEAQGLEPIGYVPMMAEVVNSLPDARNVERYRAAQSAFADWYSILEGHGWMLHAFETANPDITSFFELDGVRGLSFKDLTLEDYYWGRGEQVFTDQQRAAWSQGQDSWRREWVGYLHATGYWDRFDAAVYTKRVVSPNHTRGGAAIGGSTRSLARSLALRLRVGIDNNSPEEIASSINGLRRLAELGVLVSPGRSTDPAIIEASGILNLVSLVVMDAIHREAFEVAGLEAAAGDVEHAVRLHTKLVILHQHASLLSELDAMPAVVELMLRQVDPEEDGPDEIELIRGILDHVEQARDDVVMYSQARLKLRDAIVEHDADGRAEARTRVQLFEDKLHANAHQSSEDLLYVLFGLPVVSNEVIRSAELSALASWRSCQVLIAAERARLKWGRWPEDLAEITPRLLKEVPADPWSASGEPLRYQRKGDGFVLWSVGPDGIDNGGKVDPDTAPDPGEGFDLVLWPRAD